MPNISANPKRPLAIISAVPKLSVVQPFRYKPWRGYIDHMTYKVVADLIPDCDCEDCRAGRHLYSLFRWRDGQWLHIGFSLKTYASPQDCMRNHLWGIQFEPDAVWEDGSPVVQPKPTPVSESDGAVCGPKRMVQVDGVEFGKQMETLLKHIRALRFD